MEFSFLSFSDTGKNEASVRSQEKTRRELGHVTILSDRKEMGEKGRSRSEDHFSCTSKYIEEKEMVLLFSSETNEYKAS